MERSGWRRRTVIGYNGANPFRDGGGIVVVLPNLGYGGLQRVGTLVADETMALARHVTIVCFESGPLEKLIPKDVHVTNLGTGRLRRSVFGLTRAINRAKPSTVFSTATHTNVLLLALKAIGLVRARLVVREPSVWSDSTKHEERFSVHGVWRFGWLLRLLYRHADRIVATSYFMADDIVQHLGPSSRSKVRMIRNPVDRDAISKSAESCARTGTANVHIACVGRLTYQKGIETLLSELAGANCDWQLDIVGDGPMRGNLEHLANDLGVAKRVTFHGALQDPWACIGNARALVLPSRWEGMPNVALEALEARMTVYATTACQPLHELRMYGCDVVVRDTVGEIVRDVECLAEGASGATSQADRLGLPREFAREHVGEQYRLLFSEIE